MHVSESPLVMRWHSRDNFVAQQESDDRLIFMRMQNATLDAQAYLDPRFQNCRDITRCVGGQVEMKLEAISSSKVATIFWGTTSWSEVAEKTVVSLARN